MARIVLVLALLATMAAMATVGWASANGAHARAKLVFSGAVGPYEVRVLTVPAVGNLHVPIYLTRAGSTIIVDQATVRLWGYGPTDSSSAVEPVLATAAFGSPGWYTANLPVATAGAWSFTLEVASDLGEATVDFTVDVQEPGGGSWSLVGIVLVLLAVIAAAAFLWRPGKSRRARPQGGSP